MILEIINIIAPIFICSGVGYVWAKRGLGYDAEFVTRLVANVGFPCLIFSSLSKSRMTDQTFEAMSLAALFSVALFFIIGALLLKILKLEQSTYLPSLALANTGNMGVPLCLFAFGSTGLTYGFAYFWVQSIIVFSAGSAIAARTLKISALLKMPLIWSVGLAFIFNYFSLSLPIGLDETIRILGEFSIPLCLITLGASLSSLKVTSIGKSIILSVFRLTSGLAIGIWLSELFDFTGVARGVLIIQCCMPSAVLNYLFAEMHHNQPKEIAGIVMISTLFSFLTLPILLWFVM